MWCHIHYMLAYEKSQAGRLKVPLIVPRIWYTPLVKQNRSGPEAGCRNRREHHEIRSVGGHVEVYTRGGVFLFSADTVREAMEELEEAA